MFSVSLKDVAATGDLRIDAHHFQLRKNITQITGGILLGHRLERPALEYIKNGENLQASAYAIEDSESELFYVSVGSLSSFTLNLTAATPLVPQDAFDYVPPIDQMKLLPDEVLITRSGTPGIAWANAPTVSEAIVPSGFLIRMKPDKTLLRPEYLAAVLNHPVWRLWTASLSAGKRQRNISQEHLSEIAIPAIPLVVQDVIADRYRITLNRINEILKSPTSILEACDEVLRRNLGLLFPRLVKDSRTLDSVSIEACGVAPNLRMDARFHRGDMRRTSDALKSIPVSPLKEFVSGRVEKSKQPVILPDDKYEDPRVIATVSLQGGQVVKEMTKQSTEDFVEKNERGVLTLGDLLITMDGDGSIGKAAVFEGEFVAVLDCHVGRLKVSSVQLALALACFINSSLGQAQIEQFTSGSTGQTQIAADDLLSIKVPKSLISCTESIAGDYRNVVGRFETVTVSVRKELCSFASFLTTKFTESPGVFTSEACKALEGIGTKEQLLSVLGMLKPSMF